MFFFFGGREIVMEIESKMKKDKRERETVTKAVSALQNVVSGKAISMQISCMESSMH